MAPKKHCPAEAELEAGVGGNDGRSRASQLEGALPVWWSSEMGRLACSELMASGLAEDSSPGPLAGPGTRIAEDIPVTVTMRRRHWQYWQLKSLRRRQVPDAPLIMQALPGSRTKRLICGPLRTVGYAFEFVKTGHESRKIRPTVLQKGETGGCRRSWRSVHTSPQE